MMDDVLVFGRNQEEHKERLKAVMSQLRKKGVTLNRDKCEFGMTEVKFLGHIVSQDGIHPDPEKVSAINQMKTPQNVSDLRRFMGLVNQLGKFSSAVAQISQPLRVVEYQASMALGTSSRRSLPSSQNRDGKAECVGVL